jgi:hypothetical protein
MFWGGALFSSLAYNERREKQKLKQMKKGGEDYEKAI